MIKAIFWLAVASFITWMLWPQHNGPYGLPRGEVVTNNVWYCTPSTNRFVDVDVTVYESGKVLTNVITTDDGWIVGISIITNGIIPKAEGSTK